MGQQVNYKSELKIIIESKVKTITINKIVFIIRPETKWSNHEQAENKLIFIGGLNSCMLQNVEKTCD
jgi:hypothetical protein